MKKLSSISPSVVPQWTPCEQCGPNGNGWVKANDLIICGTRVPSLKRCPCWSAHQQRVADALKAAGKKKK